MAPSTCLDSHICTDFMQFHRNMCMCWPNKGMKNRIQIEPLSAGFEPARGDPNGFLVHRLNHSAKDGANGTARGGAKK